MTDQELQDIETRLAARQAELTTLYASQRHVLKITNVDTGEVNEVASGGYLTSIVDEDIRRLTADLRRLRAVLDAARVAAAAGNWNGCKAALFETGGDA